MPHFLYGEEKLFDMVHGLSPDKNTHEIYLSIDPVCIGFFVFTKVTKVCLKVVKTNTWNRVWSVPGKEEALQYSSASIKICPFEEKYLVQYHYQILPPKQDFVQK